MANHTPEPWKHIDYGDYGAIVGADGSQIASNLDYYPVCVSDDNQLRIVACVNACAGIPDDLLQDDDKNIINRYTQHLRNETVRQADLLAAVIAQRDELLATMRKLACLGNGDQYGNSAGNTIAQEAIAKCEVQNDERR